MTSMKQAPRYAIGRMPISGDFVIDRLEGPRKIAVRSEYDDEVMRFASREDAVAAAGRLGLTVR